MKNSTKIIIFSCVACFLIGSKLAHHYNKPWQYTASESLGDKK